MTLCGTQLHLTRPRSKFKYKPSMDSFATAEHHHVERYVATKQDANAAAINAFSVDLKHYEWTYTATPRSIYSHTW